MILKRMAIFGMLAAVLAGWGMAGPAWAKSAAGPGDLPAVFFPEKIFEFTPVIEGANVVHDFVVLNKGAAPLLINNVKTG
jgi:hypothetical protein